jgi:hypothetical protein
MSRERFAEQQPRGCSVGRSLVQMKTCILNVIGDNAAPQFRLNSVTRMKLGSVSPPVLRELIIARLLHLSLKTAWRVCRPSHQPHRLLS